MCGLQHSILCNWTETTLLTYSVSVAVTLNPSACPGWLDSMVRVPLNGQQGLQPPPFNHSLHGVQFTAHPEPAFPDRFVPSVGVAGPEGASFPQHRTEHRRLRVHRLGFAVYVHAQLFVVLRHLDDLSHAVWPPSCSWSRSPCPWTWPHPARSSSPTSAGGPAQSCPGSLRCQKCSFLALLASPLFDF